MIDDRDLNRLLDTWFADGPVQVADRVIDGTANRIARQHQLPAWRLRSWRFPTMSTPLKLVLIGAALVAALAAGAVLVGGGSRIADPTPTPSPTPSPSPTPTASPTAVYPAWFSQQSDGAGILPAGSQTTRRFLGGSTFNVPAGWVNDGDYAPVYTLFPDTPANEAEYALSKQTAQNVLLTDRVEDNMFAICDATGLFKGGTASEVIDAVVANEAFRFWASEPIDATIGGLGGRQVDLQLSPEWAGSCRLNADDPPTKDYLDARMRLIVLDTPDGGTIGIAISSGYSSAFEAFLADAMPIVESLEFGLGPVVSPTPQS
jgi:hypothetical protein